MRRSRAPRRCPGDQVLGTAEDLLVVLAGVNVIQDDRGHDSCSLDARLSVTDLGVDRNSISPGIPDIVPPSSGHGAFPFYFS